MADTTTSRPTRIGGAPEQFQLATPSPPPISDSTARSCPRSAVVEPDGGSRQCDDGTSGRVVRGRAMRELNQMAIRPRATRPTTMTSTLRAALSV